MGAGGSVQGFSSSTAEELASSLEDNHHEAYAKAVRGSDTCGADVLLALETGEIRERLEQVDGGQGAEMEQLLSELEDLSQKCKGAAEADRLEAESRLLPAPPEVTVWTTGAYRSFFSDEAESASRAAKAVE